MVKAITYSIRKKKYQALEARKFPKVMWKIVLSLMKNLLSCRKNFVTSKRVYACACLCVCGVFFV